MSKPQLNIDTYDAPVFLVIDRNAVIDPQRTFTLEYQDTSIVITVVNPERAFSLLPNVAVDALIHDHAIEDDIMGARIKTFAEKSQPTILVVDARALGMNLGACRKKAMRMLRGPMAAEVDGNAACRPAIARLASTDSRDAEFIAAAPHCETRKPVGI